MWFRQICGRRAFWVVLQKQEHHIMQPKVLTEKRNKQIVETHLRDLSTSSSIDEFRKREETREKEYEYKLSIKDKDEKTNEKNREAEKEEEAKNEKLIAIRTKILESSLQYVSSLGWSRNALIRGAEEVGYPSVVHGMFPDGGYALVSYYNGNCNKRLLEIMQEETINGQQKVSDPVDFVFRAIRARLEMLIPYKSHWPQAIALMAAPQNASNALAQLLTLVDDICYYAGDRSVNMRWYTRRLGIASIMKMTELFMLQDSSQAQVNTWEFLKMRLEDAMRLQSFLKQSEGAKNNFQNTFSNAFETARNILGIGYERRS